MTRFQFDVNGFFAVEKGGGEREEKGGRRKPFTASTK